MGQVRREHHLGQLARQRFGVGAALSGFGTAPGPVAAAAITTRTSSQPFFIPVPRPKSAARM
jgi:hypothetical protein